MIDDLLRFKKVVEAGSISKASRLLYVSQPALSQAVKLLEDQYGVELLERHYSGIQPTVFGELLYRSACEIEQSILNLKKRILAEKKAADPGTAKKEIHIGCSTIWNDYLLPEAMRSLDILNSHAIHVTNDTSEQLLTDLMTRGKYDFVLCRILENRKFKNLKSIPLLKTQASVFINRRHPFFTSGIDKEKLKELKWIKLKSMPILHRQELTPAGISYFPKNFFPPRVAYEVEDLMAAIQLVTDDYIILLPLAMAGLLEKYDIIPLPFPTNLTKTYWLGMVFHRDKDLPVNVLEVMNKIHLLYSSRDRLNRGENSQEGPEIKQ